MRDLPGERQAGIEEGRLVAVPKQPWVFADQNRRDPRIDRRGQRDEDRGAESLADDLVAAEQFHQQHGGGKDRESLQQADQRKPFEAVHAVGFRSSRSIHGGVSWSEPSPARTVIAAGKLAVPATRGRDADHTYNRWCCLTGNHTICRSSPVRKNISIPFRPKSPAYPSPSRPT